MKSLWIVLYWCWVASEIVLAVWRRTARGGGDIQDRGSQLILWAVIIPSLTICEVIRHTLPPDLPGERWLDPLSLVLLIGGLSVRWTAIVSIAANASNGSLPFRATSILLRHVTHLFGGRFKLAELVRSHRGPGSDIGCVVVSDSCRGTGAR